METEAEAGGGTTPISPKFVKPFNIKGFSTVCIGPWRVFLVGEYHIYGDKLHSPSYNIGQLYQLIMRVIDDKAKNMVSKPCIDLFIEHPHTAGLLRRFDKFIPHAIINATPILSGGQSSLDVVLDIFESMTNWHYNNIPEVRLHYTDFRSTFHFADSWVHKITDEWKRNRSADAISLPCISIITDPEYDTEAIKKEIIKYIKEDKWEFESNKLIPNASAVADQAIREHVNVRRRIDREFNAIHLPQAIKEKISPWNMFKHHGPFRHDGLHKYYSSSSRLYESYQEYAKADILRGWNISSSRFLDITTDISTIKMDLYLFYRLLKSYDPLGRRKNEKCLPYNRYSIVHIGDFHRRSLLRFFNYLAEVINLYLRNSVPTEEFFQLPRNQQHVQYNEVSFVRGEHEYIDDEGNLRSALNTFLSEPH